MQKNIKVMPVSEKLQEQINKYINLGTKDITVFEGSITELTGTNVILVAPIKIVVKKDDVQYTVLHYGEYSRNENDIYVNTKNNKISWLKLIESLKSAKN